MYSIMSSAKSLLLFWSAFLLFLFLLWLLQLGLSELCWIIVVTVDTLVLFLILGGSFQIFTIENNVCYRLIIYGLYYVEVGSFYAHVLKSFNHNWVLNFVKGFFCIYWDDHMAFIFQFVNMVYHIDWFAYIEESLHLWNKLNLIWCMSFLMCC